MFGENGEVFNIFENCCNIWRKCGRIYNIETIVVMFGTRVKSVTLGKLL